MEIKLNKDIQKLQDSFFIGLNFRQTVFGGLGLALGALAYLETTKHGINTELASWICIAIVAPFAALGFVTYHGMPFEQLVRVWVKHYILRWNLSRGFSAKHNVSENSVQNICRAVSPQRMRIIGSMVFFYL